MRSIRDGGRETLEILEITALVEYNFGNVRIETEGRISYV